MKMRKVFQKCTQIILVRNIHLELIRICIISFDFCFFHFLLVLLISYFPSIHLEWLRFHHHVFGGFMFISLSQDWAWSSFILFALILGQVQRAWSFSRTITGLYCLILLPTCDAGNAVLKSDLNMRYLNLLVRPWYSFMKLLKMFGNAW